MKPIVHRKHTIEFNETTGQFVTVLGGNKVSKPSLASAKGAIDRWLKKPFPKFKAVVISRHMKDTGKVITVIGVALKRFRHGGMDDRFIDSKGRRFRPTDLMMATPDNKVAVATYRAEHRKAEAQIEKIRARLMRFENRIVAPKLSDYLRHAAG